MGVLNVIPDVRGTKLWSPRELPALEVWQDFSVAGTLFTDAGTTQVVNDSDAIYQANDRSGHGNHVIQTSAPARPLHKRNILNGRAVGRFDAINDGMTCATPTLSQPLTQIVVVKLAVVDSVANIPLDSLGGTGCWVGTWSGLWSIYAGSSVNSPGSVAADTNATILVGTFNGASSKLWINGGVGGVAGGPGSNGMSGLSIGYDTKFSVPLKGDLGDSVVCSTILSLDDINRAGSHFGAKYGITWTTAS